MVAMFFADRDMFVSSLHCNRPSATGKLQVASRSHIQNTDICISRPNHTIAIHIEMGRWCFVFIYFNAEKEKKTNNCIWRRQWTIMS